MCVSPSAMSDHHLIYASFELNTSLLKDEDNDEAIKMMTSLCKLYSTKMQPMHMWIVLVESWRK